MQIRDDVPGIKYLFALWIVTAFIWSMLEGGQTQVVLFGWLTTLTGLVYLFRRLMCRRRFAAVPGLLIMGLWGLAMGAGSVLMTLFLMAVKTGMHGHGPEFNPAEIGAVWQQLPMWSLVGLIAGLGVGLLAIARTAD